MKGLSEIEARHAADQQNVDEGCEILPEDIHKDRTTLIARVKELEGAWEKLLLIQRLDCYCYELETAEAPCYHCEIKDAIDG